MDKELGKNNNEQMISHEDAQEIVDLICFPRLPGTEGSKKAVNLIIEKFKEIGLVLKKDPFKATKFWISTMAQMGTLLALLLTIFMVILSFIAPKWNILVIGSVLFLAIWGLSKASGGELKLIGKLIDTENLIGNIPPSNEKKGTIILMGHHDTKSQVLTTVQRSACFTIGAVSILVLVLVYTTIGIFDIISEPIPFWLTVISYIAASLIIVTTIPLTLNFTQNKSPGCLDNASSIAALYMLSKYFLNKPLKNFEVLILITGAEELAMMGAHHFAKEYKGKIDPRSTYCINFDMIGRVGCAVEIMETSGLPKPKPVNKKLNHLAKTSAEELGYEFSGFYLPVGAATDRFVIAKMGIEAMDFINKKAAFETHTKYDCVDRFDAKLCTQFVEVAAKVAEKLDK